MGNRIVGVLTVALGCLVLALALPRAAAYFSLMPGDAAAHLMFSEQKVTREGYLRLIRSREAALRWVDLPQAWVHLGGARYVRYLDGEVPTFAEERHLRQARAELERGLARSPAHRFAWVWLFDIRAMLGDDEAALQALRMAFLVAPHDANLAMPRTAGGLSFWDQLDEELRGYVERDARTVLASREAPSFVEAIAEIDQLDRLRQAVASDPETSAKLAGIVAKLKLE